MTKNSAFRALVIDDEPLAREELCQLLNETNEVHVLGEAANAIEGLALIKQHRPDVIFLDIEMPQLSGLDMLAMLDLDTMPYVVLKPVEPERLDKTVARLKKRTQPQTDIDAIASPTLVHIPCVGHQRILLLPESDIHFAYSDVAGVHVRSLEQQADTQLTLKTLEERTALVRCHRQYLVRLSCVAEIKLLDNGLATLLMKTGDSVPVSRRYLKKLKSLLTL